jgi:fibronectin-binding autotransporter adhesin
MISQLKRSLALLLIPFYGLYSIDYIYTGGAGGDWSLESNWSDNPGPDTGTIPNANTATITFNSVDTVAPAQSTGSTITIKGITNANTGSNTGNRVLSGNDTIQFSSGAGNAFIINSDVDDDLQFNVKTDISSNIDISGGAGAITFRKNVSGTGNMAISGAGTTVKFTNNTAVDTSWTGNIRVDDSATLNIGGSDDSTGAVMTSTGVLTFAHTLSGKTALSIDAKNQTSFGNTIKLINKGVSSGFTTIRLGPNNTSGAIIDWTGQISSYASDETTQTSFEREILIIADNFTNKSLKLSGDNSNFSMGTNPITIQKLSLLINHANAVGTNNASKLRVTLSGDAGIYSLGNRNIQGSLFVYGNTDGSTVTIGGDNQGAASGTTTYSGAVSLNTGDLAGNTRTVSLFSNNSENVVFSGVISDGGTNSMNLAKIGTGTVTLSGNNTYKGTTSINAGALVINGIQTGTGNITVASGSALYGTGTISANITSLAGTLSAGNGSSAVGKMTVAGSGSDLSNGTFVWDIGDLSGSEGVNWDLLEFSSVYDLSNLNGSPLNIYIHDTNSYIGPKGGIAGNTYKIMNNVINFDANYFNLSNNLINTNWTITESGGALFLSYQVVPEPETYLSISALILLLGMRFIRRKFNQK